MNCINRIVTILAVLLAAILLASPTHAGDCFPFVRPVYRQPVIVVPPVHVPVVKPVVATFVPIPIFSAVYDPRIVAYPGVPGGLPVADVPGEGVPGVPTEGQPATQPLQAAPSTGNEVLDYLRRMEARLDRLEAQGFAQGSTPAPFDYGRVSLPSQFVAQGPPVQARLGRNAVMLARCVSCHDNSTAGSKGGGVELTRGGKVVPMSEALSASADEEVRSGRMPRGRPLSTNEMQQFLQR